MDLLSSLVFADRLDVLDDLDDLDVLDILVFGNGIRIC